MKARLHDTFRIFAAGETVTYEPPQTLEGEIAEKAVGAGKARWLPGRRKKDMGAAPENKADDE